MVDFDVVVIFCIYMRYADFFVANICHLFPNSAAALRATLHCDAQLSEVFVTSTFYRDLCEVINSDTWQDYFQ